MSRGSLPRRFYTDAEVCGSDGAWQVELDGRTLRTPAKAVLALPSHGLAAAVAQEWKRQGDTLDVHTMHLTRLANVAIDRTPVTRQDITDEVVKYCETDLLCHLADAPAGLRDRQEAGWRPVRDWAGPALGVLLVPVTGILPTPQPAASLDAARNHAMSLDDFRLTGLVFGCSLFGSALLALAVERGELEGVEAWARSRIDEDFQAELWGRDAEADAVAAWEEQQADALGTWFSVL